MPLDKEALHQALKNAFLQSFKSDKPIPDATKQAQDDAAKALADAIHSYVIQADVTGVTVQITGQMDPATNKVTGSGTQTGTAKLQ
jgi:hypothetical protein